MDHGEQGREDECKRFGTIPKGRRTKRYRFPFQIPRPLTNMHVPVVGYQCYTCKGNFPTFQALGEHRAVHKKPRLSSMLEIKKVVKELEEKDNKMLEQIMSSFSAKPRVHPCKTCDD